METEVNPLEEVQVSNNVQNIYEIDLTNPGKLYIFDIDVGNMPTGKAAEVVERNKTLINRQTFDHKDTFNFIVRPVRVRG